MKNLKQRAMAPFAAAAGLGLMLAAGSASASVQWSQPTTLFEDDDVDFLIKGTGNTTAGIIEEGDYLLAVVELEKSAGSFIAPDELTGVSVIEVDQIIGAGAPGGATILFKPPTVGMDSFLNGVTLANGAGAAGGGAMVAYFLDPTPDLDISADTLGAGNGSCYTLALCIAQATDGTEWMSSGFAGDPDELWIATGAQLDTSIVDGAPLSQKFGLFNAGLSVLHNSTGRELVPNALE